ncbi:MAG: hypothetical protein IKZ66_06185 [Schwartzia sp.]|jgi:hypothetical protein|nr:hypothetical protein [Schwartzia sp. (in: firmicutes)]
MDVHFYDVGDYSSLCRIYARMGLHDDSKTTPSEGNEIFAVAAEDDEGEILGLSSGMFHRNEGSFQIFAIHLLPERRTKALAAAVLRELFVRSLVKFHPSCYTWRYRLQDESRDPYRRLAESLGLSWLPEGRRERVGTLYKMMAAKLREKDTGPNHNGDYWNDEGLARRGFVACPWGEAGEGTRQRIRGVLDSPEEDVAGLSPFVGEDYDPETSFVLTDAKNGAVCGWVICRRLAEKIIELRRWYVTKAYRRRRAGLWLGAYMLRIIQECRDVVYFTVLTGSDSMARFARGYLGGAMAEESPLCRMVWEIGDEPLQI